MRSHWKPAFITSSSIFSFLLFYCYAYFGKMDTAIALAAVAGTGGFTMGISLGIAPAVRYLGSPRRFFRYRKGFGIIGYFYSLVYTLGIVALTPEQYFANFPSLLLTVPSILGIISMTILTMMTLISNQTMVTFFGFTLWKRIMRIGYAAYGALVVRAILIEGDIWMAWLTSPDLSIPPPRLLLSIFATLVIVTGISQHLIPKPAPRIRLSSGY